MDNEVLPNAYCSMVGAFPLKVIFLSFLQPSNAKNRIALTEAGRVISLRLVQP